MCEYFCFCLDVDICQSGLSSLVFVGPSVLAVYFVSRCQDVYFTLQRWCIFLLWKHKRNFAVGV